MLVYSLSIFRQAIPISTQMSLSGVVCHVDLRYVDRMPTLKPVSHFNRIVANRSVFHCFMNTHQAELMIWTR